MSICIYTVCYWYMIFTKYPQFISTNWYSLLNFQIDIFRYNRYLKPWPLQNSWHEINWHKLKNKYHVTGIVSTRDAFWYKCKIWRRFGSCNIFWQPCSSRLILFPSNYPLPIFLLNQISAVPVHALISWCIVYRLINCTNK